MAIMLTVSSLAYAHLTRGRDFVNFTLHSTGGYTVRTCTGRRHAAPERSAMRRALLRFELSHLC